MAKSIELGTVLLALILLVLLYMFVGNPMALLINAIIAILLLFLLNMLLRLGIPINLITVLIVVIGGLLGLVLVILLNRLKIAFY